MSASRPRLLHPVVKSALTSGGLTLIGDVLAQLLTQGKERSLRRIDKQRSIRMGGFGLLLYGPYQHYWYRALDRRFAGRSVPNFLAKYEASRLNVQVSYLVNSANVTLNQVALSPVVLAAVFSWNFAWQAQSNRILPKIRQDLVPTMVNGWKFWVPAASVNFLAVPLQQQVLYMSICGVLWTGYLSYSSNLPQGQRMSAAGLAAQPKVTP